MELESIGQRSLWEVGINTLPFLDAKFLQSSGSQRLAGGGGWLLAWLPELHSWIV